MTTTGGATPTSDPDPAQDPAPPPAAGTVPALNRRQRTARLIHQAFTWQGWATLTTITTAVAAVAALYFTGQTLRATNAQNSTSRESAITDRIAKATDQLSSDKINSKLAGIYLLERLASDSPTDREVIVELLSAFIRNDAPESKCTLPDRITEKDVRPAAHIQAAVTVLGRMPRSEREVDLSYSCLAGANMSSGNFRNFVFNNSVLVRADFESTNLSGSTFRDADVTLGRFYYSDLSNTHWDKANATDAVFISANITGAQLAGINISGADISRIHGLTIEHFTQPVPGVESIPFVYCDLGTSWPASFPVPRCGKW